MKRQPASGLSQAFQAFQAYALRHWRGAFGLPRSFWLHAVLPCAVLTALVQAGLAWVAAPAARLQPVWLGLLLAAPLLAVLTVWGAAGAWRSARAYHRDNGIPLWDYAARASLVVGGAAVAATLVLDLGPQLRQGLPLLLGIDPLGGLRSQASADGARLHWQGAVGLGDAARADAWLAAAPQARLVELDITGGRPDEARQIAQALAARGLATRVTGACEDSCLLLFMAGHPHQLMPAARVGFRRVATGSGWPAVQHGASRRMAALYRTAGLPERLIDRALGGSRSGVWLLDAHDLQLAGLVGVPGRPLDVELPAGATVSVADDAEALNTHPLWRALDQRFPGTVSAAAQALAAARQAGAEGEALQLAAQAVPQPLWGALLARVDAPLREKFVRGHAEALRAAQQQSEAACAQVMTGDLQARRQLPLAQRLQEAEWLSDVLAESATPPPTRPATAIEREVLQRALGRGALAALAGLRPWPAKPPLACGVAIQLLDNVAGLAVPERRLALRLMAVPG